MSAFEKIQIQGFRRLKNIDLQLKALNVLIGANGCGKTTFLDVFSLLAASAAGALKSAIADFGGVQLNLTQVAGGEAATKQIHFCLDKLAPKKPPLKYDIAIQPTGVSYEIGAEMLTQQREASAPQPHKFVESIRGRIRYFDIEKKKLLPPDWEHDPLETALSQVPSMFREPTEFRKNLASSTHYHVLDVGPRAPVRLPQPMREAKLPGKDGEDLVSCLYWLREADRDRFEIIEDTLRIGFPNFERLNFPPVAAGTIALSWQEKGMKHPFFMHQLSEGTLRFLWLVTLLYSPGLASVTMIDEPEVSLHPELLSVLAECLREASKRTQLIVATHADRLVRFLRPEEVIVLDVQQDGSSTATGADELDLDAWLKEYTLDEVWQHGRMGGRP